MNSSCGATRAILLLSHSEPHFHMNPACLLPGAAEPEKTCARGGRGPQRDKSLGTLRNLGRALGVKVKMVAVSVFSHKLVIAPDLLASGT